MRTHYDNLQVSRNASDRVIRAAYKSLAQEWHPDKHPKNRERAEKYLKIINRAYQVLSDPKTRKEHDDWIDSTIDASRFEEVAQEPDHYARPEASATSPDPPFQDKSNPYNYAQDNDYAQDREESNLPNSAFIEFAKGLLSFLAFLVKGWMLYVMFPLAVFFLAAYLFEYLNRS